MRKFQILLTKRGETYLLREMSKRLGPSNCVRVDIVTAIEGEKPIFCGDDISVQKIRAVVNACCAKYYDNPDEKYSTHSIVRCLEKGYIYFKAL